MSEIRAVLLDAGRTLFTERRPRPVLYAEAARARGLAVSDEAMARAMARTHDALPQELEGAFRYSERWFTAFIDEVFLGFGFRGDLADLRRALFSTFDDPATFQVFPDVRPALQSLRSRSKKLAVVSNWSPRLTVVLARLGLAAFFDTVLASAVVRAEKPDPRIFRRAAAELGVEVEQCIHVGDHPEKDVAGAVRAGMRAYLLDRTGEFLERADRVASLREVVGLCG